MTNKDLKKCIKKLRDLNKKPKSLEWNKSFIFSEGLRGLFILIRGISNFADSEVYRVRSLGEKECISDPKTYKYPPIEYNSLGRTNLVEKQILYSSTCATTAILEYLNTGTAKEIIYLAIWKFKNKQKKSIDTFEIKEFTDNLDYLKWKFKPGSDSSTLRLVKEIFDLYVKLFKSKNYNFSAPFSHLLVYTHNICNMIKYPSVVTDSNSFNYAINIDFFDEEFELDRVYKIEVFDKFNLEESKAKNDIHVLMIPLEIGKNNGGQIIFEPFDEKKDTFWKNRGRKLKS